MMIQLKIITKKLQSLNKMIIAVLAYIIYVNTAFSQINLVPNPSFENIKHCPTGGSQIDSAIAWSTPKNGGGGDPDLFNSCSTPNACGVPFNTFNLSYQWAHSGIGYAGIDVALNTSPNNSREYIQSKLLSKLIGGRNYCITFYASLTNHSTESIKPLGAYLDSGNVYAPTYNGLAIANPQIYNTTQQLSDTLNWMKVEGSFTASGIETYITLGNFFTDANSDTVISDPTNSGVWFSYYYIDDVSVIDISTPAHAGNDTTIISGDSVFVGRPPEVGLNEDCIWFVNSLPIDTVAGMWVKPTTTTTYVLQQSICGTVTYDSVKVNVSGVGINELSNREGLKIYPNPFTFQTTISFNEIQKNTTIKIMDVLGKEIKTVLLSGAKSLTIEKGEMQSGIYFVQVIDANKNVLNRKIVLQ